MGLSLFGVTSWFAAIAVSYITYVNNVSYAEPLGSTHAASVGETSQNVPSDDASDGGS